MAELQRVGRHPLVAGVGLYSHTRPWCLDDEEFVPLFARIAESGLVAQMHPAFEPSEERYEPFALAGSLDAVFVNTLVVSRLIFGGLFDRAPDLRLIVTHLGGTLPFLVQRLHDMSAPFATTEKDIWSYCRKNLYFDNCSFHTPALVCTCATFGSDRVVLGSDFPFRGAVRRCVDDVDGGGFRTAERTAMLGRTALRLLSRR
jgi:aminocarboxymuconate-semialdehyde decarboxylase